MNDTAPEIAEQVQARLMALSNATRFKMGAHMFDAARQVVIASLPKDLPEAELNHRLYERIYGQALPF
jgi:hypothetical protein